MYNNLFFRCYYFINNLPCRELLSLKIHVIY